jgi:hypothetical protein
VLALPAHAARRRALRRLAVPAADAAVAGSEIGWPDLTLVRRLDRWLVFATLATDRAKTAGPAEAAGVDLLGSLRWIRQVLARRPLLPPSVGWAARGG